MFIKREEVKLMKKKNSTISVKYVFKFLSKYDIMECLFNGEILIYNNKVMTKRDCLYVCLNLYVLIYKKLTISSQLFIYYILVFISLFAGQ